MRPLCPTWLTALFLFLPGCEGEAPEGFRERTPSEATACFESAMGLDATPESACGVANFYVIDPTLGCSELDVPTSHKCYEPEDLSLATRVCVPAYPPLYWFDCQELFMSLWGHFEGRCTDGWLLLRGRHWFRANLCVPEAFGRWLHERGFAVSYGDLSPYDGQPVPDPVGCPEVGEALMLCGGDCGPCPASFDCLGRSPLHPFGLCAPDYYAVLKGPGQEVDFWFVPPDEPATFAAPEQLKLPLDTCLEAEASLPGGGLCDP
jgi:hypothetical protein